MNFSQVQAFYGSANIWTPPKLQPISVILNLMIKFHTSMIQLFCQTAKDYTSKDASFFHYHHAYLIFSSIHVLHISDSSIISHHSLVFHAFLRTFPLLFFIASHCNWLTLQNSCLLPYCNTPTA